VTYMFAGWSLHAVHARCFQHVWNNAHVRRSCAMNVYTMIHVRRTPVWRTCTPYIV